MPLNWVLLTTERSEDGFIHIDLAAAQECIQKRAVRYDKDGDNHYDTISAFIKSMRGSDPDAAVYYLARMLYAGEDIKFIARRIMICASEDVGNADPQALSVAVSASLAAERIGLPEAQIILSQAASYVAWCSKEQCSLCGNSECHGKCKDHPYDAGSGPSSGSPLQRCGKTRTWGRLQVCPRLSETLCKSTISSRRYGRNCFL